MKIGILTNIPTPYRKAMWEEYSKIPNTEFNVFYCAQTESDRKWKVPKASGVEEHFLNGITFGNSNHFNYEIIKLVKKYDLWIIGGYSMISAQLLIILCKFFRVPYIIMFDGISPLKINKKENHLKFFWKKFLSKNCIAWFGNGTVGKLYGMKLGIPEKRIFNQYLTINVDYFRSFLKNKKEIREKKRKELGIPLDAFIILYVGRLVKQKGVQDLIEAFKQIHIQEQNTYLMIVGHGDYEEKLKKQASKIESVIFSGNVKYSKIHELYFTSDIFVLPTYNDHWGLVINEALACELPIITTFSCGASLDLLKNNGYICSPGNIDCYCQAIQKLINNRVLQCYFSKCSSDIINKYKFKNSAKELKRFLAIFKGEKNV